MLYRIIRKRLCFPDLRNFTIRSNETIKVAMSGLKITYVCFYGESIFGSGNCFPRSYNIAKKRIGGNLPLKRELCFHPFCRWVYFRPDYNSVFKRISGCNAINKGCKGSISVYVRWILLGFYGMQKKERKKKQPAFHS